MSWFIIFTVNTTKVFFRKEEDHLVVEVTCIVFHDPFTGTRTTDVSSG